MEYIFLFNLLLLIIFNNFSKCDLDKEKFCISMNVEEVLLKIKGGGTQKVLSDTFTGNANEIYKGVDKLATNSKQINLDTNSGIVEIKLVFNQKLTDCYWMFNNLKNILYIDLSSFDISEVTNFRYMFYGCHSLTSIVFGKFYTSKAANMESIFEQCKSLVELDLSMFNTNSVTNMASMFCDCSNLTSLDLSNFITDNVEDMGFMFDGCSNLVSINLSNFQISSVTNMNKMFRNCINLEYINLAKANPGSSPNMENIFENVPLNLVICVNNFDSIINKLSSLTYHTKDCSENWRNSQKKKRVIIDDTYVDTCTGTSKYEFENKCYQQCPNSTKDNNNDYICEKIIEQKIITTQIEYKPTTYIVKEKKIITTQIEYKPTTYIVNEQKIETTQIINANQNPTIYYNEINQQMTGKNNEVEIKETDIKNREETNIGELPNNTISKITCTAKDFLYNKCKINSTEEKSEIGKNIVESILEGSLGDILKEILQTDTEFKKSFENEIIHIMTLPDKIDLNETNTNHTIIDFGNCTNLLRDIYGLQDKEIFLLMIEHIFEEINIPLTEYYLFDEDGKMELSLDVCSDQTINKYFSVEVDEEDEYKYNPYSDYYSDGCYPSAEENGIDMTLYDRQEVFNNERATCEKNCTYKEYNYVNKKINCECRVETEFVSFYNISIDKKKLLNTFTNIKKKSNINVIKCQNLLFNKDILITNIGSYIIIGIIFFSFICSVSFCFKDFSALKFKINIVCFLEPKNVGEIKNTKTNIKKKIKNNPSFVFNNLGNNKKKKKRILSNPIKHIELNNNKNRFKQKGKIVIPSKKLIAKKKTKLSTSKRIISTNNKRKNTKNIFQNKNKKSQKNQNNLFEISEYEINNFKFEEAIQFDHRSYCNYYLSLIRTKHLLIFTFCINNDYNSKAIKISLFFHIFALFYSVNAMFFNDSTMHEILESNGKYNIIYQIPQIIYSSLISTVFKIVLSYLSLSESNIIELKNTIKLEKMMKSKMKNKNMKKVFNDSERVAQLNRCITIKSFLFFIIDFMTLTAFWYYIASFGAVFENTQMHLLEDTLISFGTSLIYPFFIYLLPGIFRIPALRFKSDCLYRISKLLQML